MQSTTSPLAIPLEKAYPPLRVVGERRETEVEKARFAERKLKTLRAGNI
jgi:hypothetical protein